MEGHRLPLRRTRLFAALVAASLTAFGALSADAQAPKIGKPRPAPDTPPNVPRPTTAVHDGTLAIGGEDVDARKVNTRLSVDVQVNGRGPYKFVVDSGADTSAVGLRIARDLQLPLGTPVTLHSITARNIVDRVRVAALKIGSTTFSDKHLPALAEQDLGADGLLGIDALVAQRLMMDFDKKTIKVEDARVPVKVYPNEIVITAVRRKGQLILTQVRAGTVPLEAVIDTGSEVSIGNSVLLEKLRRSTRNKFYPVEVTGVTGVKVVMQLAIIPELRLGPVMLRDVPIAFADVPPFALFGMQAQPAMLVGTDLLETFQRVSLDFRARKVRFQLRQCAARGVLFNTAAIATGSRIASRISSTGGPEVCGR